MLSIGEKEKQYNKIHSFLPNNVQQTTLQNRHLLTSSIDLLEDTDLTLIIVKLVLE